MITLNHNLEAWVIPYQIKHFEPHSEIPSQFLSQMMGFGELLMKFFFEGGTCRKIEFSPEILINF